MLDRSRGLRFDCWDALEEAATCKLEADAASGGRVGPSRPPAEDLRVIILRLRRADDDGDAKPELVGEDGSGEEKSAEEVLHESFEVMSDDCD